MNQDIVVDLQLSANDYSPLSKTTIKVIRICKNEDVEENKNGIKTDDLHDPFDNDFLKSLTSPDYSDNSEKKDCLLKILKEIQNDINNQRLEVSMSEPENKQIFSDYQGGYYGGVVGVVHKAKIPYTSDGSTYKLNVTLQICSRMDDNNKPYFLTTMLLRDKIKFNDNQVPSNEDEVMDYLMLFYLKQQLLDAYQKGFYRRYQRFEKNDDRLRGSIDIARHIRENMGQRNGKIAYSYRENTINNDLNRLIIAAYEYLKKKYYDLVTENFDNNSDLTEIITTLKIETGYSNENIRSIVSKNLKPITSPYYIEYENLRIICLRILRDEAIFIFNGDTEQKVNGFLVYLPTLWEKFLEEKMQPVVDEMQPKITLESQKEVNIFGKNNKYVQDTRPDFVLSEENQYFMVMDAKFKPKWEDVFKDVFKKNRKLRASEDGLLIDYNKCIRDMNSLGAHATGVIFPVQNDITEIIRNASTDKNEAWKNENFLIKISKYNQIDCFYMLPIMVPKVNQDYSKWQKEFDERILASMAIFKKMVAYAHNRHGIIKKCEEGLEEELKTFEN